MSAARRWPNGVRLVPRSLPAHGHEISARRDELIVGNSHQSWPARRQHGTAVSGASSGGIDINANEVKPEKPASGDSPPRHSCRCRSAIFLSTGEMRCERTIQRRGAAPATSPAIASLSLDQCRRRLFKAAVTHLPERNELLVKHPAVANSAVGRSPRRGGAW